MAHGKKYRATLPPAPAWQPGDLVTSRYGERGVGLVEKLIDGGWVFVAWPNGQKLMHTPQELQAADAGKAGDA